MSSPEAHGTGQVGCHRSLPLPTRPDQCDALKLEGPCPGDGELWEGAEALERGRELK